MKNNDDENEKVDRSSSGSSNNSKRENSLHLSEDEESMNDKDENLSDTGLLQSLDGNWFILYYLNYFKYF